MTTTIINQIYGSWTNVKNKCRTTVKKENSEIEPSGQFKKKLLIAEHSPIRLLSFDWSWRDIPSFVATHFSRHKWECFISTQRSDRTGLRRNELPQDNPVDFDGVANVQSLIDTARKRLCHLADPDTRKLMEDLKYAIKELEPEIADVLVPNCVYRCGCPEMKSCGYYTALCDTYSNIKSTDIQKRYDAFNDVFYEGEY